MVAATITLRRAGCRRHGSGRRYISGHFDLRSPPPRGGVVIEVPPVRTHPRINHQYRNQNRQHQAHGKAPGAQDSQSSASSGVP